MVAPPSLFLDAFVDIATTIVSSIPNDVDTATIKSTIDQIIIEIGLNEAKLHAFVKVVYNKAIAEVAWAPTAAKVLTCLETTIPKSIKDDTARYPETEVLVTGEKLANFYILNMCRQGFGEARGQLHWNPALGCLIAELSRFTDYNTRLMLLNIMANAKELFSPAENLEIFLDFLTRTGKELDAQAESKLALTKTLEIVEERASGQSLVVQMGVVGVSAIRKQNWER